MSLKPGKYKHYKGNYYEVMGVALHTETREKVVLYKALYDVSTLKEEYGEEPIFVRPYTMFVEKIIINGQKTSRFEYVK